MHTLYRGEIIVQHFIYIYIINGEYGPEETLCISNDEVDAVAVAEFSKFDLLGKSRIRQHNHLEAFELVGRQFFGYHIDVHVRVEFSQSGMCYLRSIFTQIFFS